MKTALLIVGSLLLSIGTAQAEQIAKPHTFSAGTPAQAEEVNANFDTVFGQVNKVGAEVNIDGVNHRVGIGTATPDVKLHVDGDLKVGNGKLTADALTLPTGAVNGSVLTSDVSGNATWQVLSTVPQALVATTVVDNGVTTASVAAGAITPDKLADTCAVGEVLIKTADSWVCGAVAPMLCNSGDFISCYRGSVTTMNVALCKAGTRTCLETGIGFGACQGEVLPTTDFCDGIDNNCDGQTDEGCGVFACGDGLCAVPAGENTGNCPVDCPGETRCEDGLDDDGDGLTDCADNDCSSFTACLDSDNDGSPDVVDCAPSDNQVYPGALEVCDDKDNDCDGLIDNITLEFPEYHWFSDLDSDTFAGMSAGHYACAPPPGFSNFVSTASSFTIDYQGSLTNPDDGSPFSGPANLEFAIYEEPNYQTAPLWMETHVVTAVDGVYQVVLGMYSPIPKYTFATSAGYLGISVNGGVYQQPGMPFGLFVNETTMGIDWDCDDTDPDINPVMPELCDGFDNNCDDQVDEGCGP